MITDQIRTGTGIRSKPTATEPLRGPGCPHGWISYEVVVGPHDRNPVPESQRWTAPTPTGEEASGFGASSCAHP